MKEDIKAILDENQRTTSGATSVAIEQIIETDRIAQEILNKANDRRKEIEQQTEIEKKEIIAECEERQVEMQTKADDELKEEFARHKKEFEGEAALQQAELEQKFDALKKQWVQDLYDGVVRLG